MACSGSSNKRTESGANIGFEAKLWLAADTLRSNMDAAEYKHVVLGLIFLKYISDAFEEHHAELSRRERGETGADREDPDEYRAENIFWVPPVRAGRYSRIARSSPTIGKSLMMPWSRSSATIHVLKASCRKTTPAPRTRRDRGQTMTDQGTSQAATSVTAKSSAVKAGWICLVLGFLTFWIFGFGFIFFAATFILAIVAMCYQPV